MCSKTTEPGLRDARRACDGHAFGASPGNAHEHLEHRWLRERAHRHASDPLRAKRGNIGTGTATGRDRDPEMSHRLAGVDVGGTFTDLLFMDETAGDVRLAKVPTTADNQAFGVLAALERAGVDPASLDLLVHGTTTTTNALLERKLASTGLIHHPGFPRRAGARPPHPAEALRPHRMVRAAHPPRAAPGGGRAHGRGRTGGGSRSTRTRWRRRHGSYSRWGASRW